MYNRTEKKVMTLDNWLCFYLSERRVLAEVTGCKSYICTDTDLIAQAFSGVERDVYEVFILAI